jgi:superoxide reductase
MAELNKFYKCEICGNLVSVIEEGAGELICCGEPMVLQQEKTSNQEGKEKHVPVITKVECGVKVTVGSIPHPMEEKHYIELIQLIEGDNVVVGKRLKPGDNPEAIFHGIELKNVLKARIICNIHGVWTN